MDKRNKKRLKITCICFIYFIFIITIGCGKNKIINNVSADAIKPSEGMQEQNNVVNAREFVDVSTLWRNSAST
jgi:hypothetical protein